MTSSKKRPRFSEPDDDKTCPFTIKYVYPGEADKKNTKRRRQTDDDDENTKVFSQLSPFAPTGKFTNKTYETLDVQYKVQPSKAWSEMTRYNSFVLNGQKYFSEGFIHVANQASVDANQGTSLGDDLSLQPQKRDGWIARILEIRASDEHHVYARVFWMYWPEELYSGTTYGKKKVSGRQPYHGRGELIASNHMDVINVISVTSPATVNQWDEANDDEIQDALYWRQALEYRTLELSSVEPNCRCGEPANPDKTLLGCTKSDCHKWLHLECLTDDALTKTWKRLGKDKPHVPFGFPEEALEDEQEGGKRPLSPKEPVAGATQPTIDVNSDGATKEAAASVEASLSVEASPSVESTEETNPKAAASPTETSDTQTLARRAKQRGKKEEAAAGDPAKPYLGLFEAKVLADATPPAIEIRDLRENVVGGEKVWIEQISCLVCGAPIN